MNMYLISQNTLGKLAKTDDKTKQNIKNWVSKYKSINDTIEIYDAKIANFSIEFTAVSDKRFSSSNVSHMLTLMVSQYCHHQVLQQSTLHIIYTARAFQ